jgi:hypothetical protein
MIMMMMMMIWWYDDDDDNVIMMFWIITNGLVWIIFSDFSEAGCTPFATSLIADYFSEVHFQTNKTYRTSYCFYEGVIFDLGCFFPNWLLLNGQIKLMSILCVDGYKTNFAFHWFWLLNIKSIICHNNISFCFTNIM